MTVVGSSIVRGVASLVDGKQFDASGYVFPGRTAGEINSCVDNLDIHESDVAVIAAGTNNIESQTMSQCKAEIGHVIDNVSRRRNNQHVIMCQLPPRYDKPYLNNKIEKVNDFIRQQVSRRAHWYLLQHDVCREDFKRDGLHFNDRGIAKYAHEVRHIIREIDSE